MTTAPPKPEAESRGGQLQRSVGFYGLMFVSLGSIIGSGWLLSAANASIIAGPASILSWILAAAMLACLALVYAELGATYPVAGGSGRFAYYSHGVVAGFVSGWASWLQAVFIAPIEVLAALTYLDAVGAIHKHFPLIHSTGASKGLLNNQGLIIAVILMILFTCMNLAGAKFMSESNSLVVVWKTAVPLLCIGVIAASSFHTGNMTSGGGFMPFGAHGVFAALPGGVVFALQGFEQAVQLAGEARNPRKDISRAVLVAMGIGALLYSLLQLVFILGVKPGNVASNWANPLGGAGVGGNFGAWYTLATSLGLTWLGAVLVIDAVISPSGTGIVYVGTSSRLSYALGQERELPRALARTNARGVPVASIILAAIVGILGFGPFKSWAALVAIVTDATAIMYAFAPIALASLHKHDGDRERTYSAPVPKVLLPASFCFANLIIYWGGFESTWKLTAAMIVGFGLFAYGSSIIGSERMRYLRNAAWIGPWLIGLCIINYMGRYGSGAKNYLPDWIDLIVVIAFSLVIFYWAISLALPTEEIVAAVEADREHDPMDDLVTS